MFWCLNHIYSCNTEYHFVQTLGLFLISIEEPVDILGVMRFTVYQNFTNAWKKTRLESKWTKVLNGTISPPPIQVTSLLRQVWRRSIKRVWRNDGLYFRAPAVHQLFFARCVGRMRITGVTFRKSAGSSFRLIWRALMTWRRVSWLLRKSRLCGGRNNEWWNEVKHGLYLWGRSGNVSGCQSNLFVWSGKTGIHVFNNSLILAKLLWGFIIHPGLPKPPGCLLCVLNLSIRCGWGSSNFVHPNASHKVSINTPAISVCQR